ncbi:MAG: DUF3465 domain-containing protein [Gammaproteobacteria bacterium]
MTNRNRKAITAALVAIIPLFFGSKYFKSLSSSTSIESLYQSRQSGVMIEFEGLVVKLLSDDNEGSRHQRFIVKLDSNHTVLIAHNIDVAPRVPLKVNQPITIYGQYEWNDRGGVVHWTHLDSYGSHEHGWINFQGKKYQ